MKRRDFLKKIGLGTATFAVAGADPALPADNGLTGIFDGTIVLGRPTACCISLNVLSNDRLEAYFEYGTQSGVYTDQTHTSTIECLLKMSSHICCPIHDITIGCVFASPAPASLGKDRSIPSIPREHRAVHLPLVSRAIRTPNAVSGSTPIFTPAPCSPLHPTCPISTY